jgi:hypothetical protein
LRLNAAHGFFLCLGWDSSREKPRNALKQAKNAWNSWILVLDALGSAFDNQ